MTLVEIIGKLKKRRQRQAKRDRDDDARVWELEGDHLVQLHDYDGNGLTTGDIMATDWIVIATPEEELAKLRRDVTRLREKLVEAQEVENNLHLQMDQLERKAAEAIEEAKDAVSFARRTQLENIRTRVRLGQVAASRRKEDGQCLFHRPRNKNSLDRCCLGAHHDVEPHQDLKGDSDGLWMLVSSDIYQGEDATPEADDAQ